MRMEMVMIAFSSTCLIFFCSVALCLYNLVVLHPRRIRNKLKQQGIDGPPPSFLYGNLSEILVMEKKASEPIKHEYTYIVLPYFDKWRKIYGPIFFYSMGDVPFLHVSHPDLVREMSLCRSLDLGKTTYMKKTHEPLFGHGIIKSNGKDWAFQRKLIAPEFFLDKVKLMVELMVDSTKPFIESWEKKIQHGRGMAEIKVNVDLQNYSADVISKACFGSSYSEGKEIFSKLWDLTKALSEPNLLVEISGLRYLPTKRNREVWRLNKEVRSLILKVIKDETRKGCAINKGLLQAIFQSASESENADDLVVDNCKSIYIAGHETVAVTAAWCLLLLSLHLEWQNRARDEVLEVCGGCPPNITSLQKMNTLTIVIHETLRLYPPTAFLGRETLKDMNFGGIHIPKGVNIYIPLKTLKDMNFVCVSFHLRRSAKYIPYLNSSSSKFLHIPLKTLHHDASTWGPDANEFNPERFSKGPRLAGLHPCMYAPFGAGRRACLGQNFAMIELKVVLALILSKFSFTLSPNYQHSPCMRLMVKPEFGVDLILKRLD